MMDLCLESLHTLLEHMCMCKLCVGVSGVYSPQVGTVWLAVVSQLTEPNITSSPQLSISSTPLYLGSVQLFLAGSLSMVTTRAKPPEAMHSQVMLGEAS